MNFVTKSLAALLILAAVVSAQQCGYENVIETQVIHPQSPLDPSDLKYNNMGHYTRVYGNTIIAGAYGHNRWEGCIYVYEKQGDGQFSFLQRLEGSHPQQGAYLGLNVDLWEDTIVGGAPYSEPEGHFRSGSVYIWKKQSSGLYSQTARLWPDDTQRGGFFGYAVSIHENRLAVGARFTRNDETGVGRAGKVYIYETNGAEWNLQEQIRNYGESNIHWADELRLVKDVLLVGAPRAYGGEGAAFAYVEKSSIVDGQEVKSFVLVNEFRILADNKDSNDHFGEGCTVSEDGNIIVVAGERANSDWANTGAAQMYLRNGDSFEFHQYIYPNRGGGLRYGQRLEIHGDMLVVGAWTSNEAGPEAGSAYIFVRCDDNYWTLQEKLVGSGLEGGENFGKMVDISDEYVIVGAPKTGEVDTDSAESGAVHIYKRSELLSVSPSVSATVAPSSSPVPSVSSTELPSVSSSMSTSEEPSTSSSATPTSTAVPSVSSTEVPSVSSSATPTSTAVPSVSSTEVPSVSSSATPTSTAVPSVSSTEVPSVSSSVTPTPVPSADVLEFTSVPDTAAAGDTITVSARVYSLEGDRVVQILIRDEAKRTLVRRLVSVQQGAQEFSQRVELTEANVGIVTYRLALLPAGGRWADRIMPGEFAYTDVQLEVPTSEPTSGPEPTPSPTPQASLVEDSVEIISSADAISVDGINVVTVSYSSNGSNEVNLMVKHPSLKTLYYAVEPTTSGHGEVTFRFAFNDDLANYIGDIVTIRAAIWPTGGVWRNRLAAGNFVDAPLTTSS